jgi:hypothetical protein
MMTADGIVNALPSGNGIGNPAARHTDRVADLTAGWSRREIAERNQIGKICSESHLRRSTNSENGVLKDAGCFFSIDLCDLEIVPMQVERMHVIALVEEFGNFRRLQHERWTRGAHFGAISRSVHFAPRRAAIVRNTPKMTARISPNRHSP